MRTAGAAGHLSALRREREVVDPLATPRDDLHRSAPSASIRTTPEVGPPERLFKALSRVRGLGIANSWRPPKVVSKSGFEKSRPDAGQTLGGWNIGRDAKVNERSASCHRAVTEFCYINTNPPRSEVSR